MTDQEVLEVTVHVKAHPETVFPYFTDPARYTRWMGAEATLEAVPGGRYRVLLRDGVQAQGHFVEVDPPRRIVFTWGWDHDQAVPAGSTRVVVTFEAQDDGTLVVLRHHGLPGAEGRARHGEGWTQYLARLAIRVAGGDPGRDPNAD